MDEDDDSTSLSSFISIGTAEVQPMSMSTSMQPAPKPHEPSSSYSPEPTALPVPAATTETENQNPTLAELIDMHRLPPMPSPPPSPQPPHQSLDTMHHLKESRENRENRRRVDQTDENRLSIIDPSTVKLSFIGTLSEMPVGLPLEEGLQKLYKLYQENDPSPTPLPRALQITDVPLTTIAESLESHILEMKAALTDCASNIENLMQTNDQTKKDLINLEWQYCIARQEANMCHMSADDFRLRLEWQREEIARVNTEKEVAIAANLAFEKEVKELRGEVDALKGEIGALREVREESERLRRSNEGLESVVGGLRRELEEVKIGLDKARFEVRIVPGPMRRLCGRVLVPVGEKGGGSDVLGEGPDGDGYMDGRQWVDEEKEMDHQAEQKRQRHHYRHGQSRLSNWVHERRESRALF